MAKEIKDLQFQQNLWTEFIKNDKAFKNKMFADLWFDSGKVFNDINVDANIINSKRRQWVL